MGASACYLAQPPRRGSLWRYRILKAAGVENTRSSTPPYVRRPA
ncbi:hypothetical protein HMPREF0742_02453 [Rothia aeria F0184]|uniref:Uncharacterized protein n=1 Tax=Rothia aeria F0184 TaxID=888019 RepID=U7V041_9MICC|nr:hypothetical protein HMPREF0742_02453 [Rothia aeria F0184]